MDEYLENNNLEELEQECFIEEFNQDEQQKVVGQSFYEENINDGNKKQQIISMYDGQQIDNNVILNKEIQIDKYQEMNVEPQNSNDKLKLFQEQMTYITELSFKRNQQSHSHTNSQQLVVEDLGIGEQLQLQMEYYFCDTNLSHDSYLRSIIDKSPKNCIDIKIFLKFNRIQQILKNLSDKNQQSSKRMQNYAQQVNIINQNKFSKKDLILLIRDSLKESKILKVKMNSLKVKRRFPFNLEQTQKNSKQKTLYIDYLPPKCSKETLLSIFGNFRIININLPLQKNSQLCKGFAFIEFVSEEEANQALQAKNNSIPKELILLTEKKIGQGSIRIITYKKWEEEKQSFKELSKIQNDQENLKISEKSLKSKVQFIPVDVQIIQNCLIKIINIPINTLKAEIVLAVRHLGYEFYCDYLDESNTINKINNQTNQSLSNNISNENIQIENNQTQIEKAPQLNHILKIGQAIIRFQNSEEKKLAAEKLLKLHNNKCQIEIKGKLCDVIHSVMEEEEKYYWSYIKYKKNEFRNYFFNKKQQKKQKQTQNQEN